MEVYYKFHLCRGLLQLVERKPFLFWNFRKCDPISERNFYWAEIRNYLFSSGKWLNLCRFRTPILPILLFVLNKFQQIQRHSPNHITLHKLQKQQSKQWMVYIMYTQPSYGYGMSLVVQCMVFRMNHHNDIFHVKHTTEKRKRRCSVESV